VAERRTSLRRRRVAFAVALLLALGGVAFLGWSVMQHRDASDELASTRAHLVTRRANTSADSKRLQDALSAVTSVKDQLTALGKGTIMLADLDQHDLDAVRAAIIGGLGGVLADYNAAVDQRTGLDPEHDAAVEQLRQQANAVITALDGIS
jgi:hypothetical protein